MKKVLFASLFLFAIIAFAQQATPTTKVVEATELEQLKFKDALKDLVIIQQNYKATQDKITFAQNDLVQIQQQYKTADDAANAVCESIKKAHKYGDDVTCNKATGEIVQTQKVETPKK